MSRTAYVGRFAPSPTGALHSGSLVAALASWLDARAHGGKWLVRIEDVDAPRCVRGADQEILRQLATCGLIPDEPPLYQSRRGDVYQAALDQLIESGFAYPCACSRKDIEQALLAKGEFKPRHGELIYPGTCRSGLHGRNARAWRFNTSFFDQYRHFSLINPAQDATESIATQILMTHGTNSSVNWVDRRLGRQQQDVSREVGDFVLRRADGLWAYQLAVVVDDAQQGVTDVVRGEDLADNTARQILLQVALSFATPAYMHTPLVLASDGQKLSKQNGAQPLLLGSNEEVRQAIAGAAQALGLKSSGVSTTISGMLRDFVTAWRATL